MPFAYFHALCPNCGGRISADRLEAGLACENCLKEVLTDGDLCTLLRSANKLDGYRWVCYLRETEQAFASFFRRHLGVEPWSLQQVWAKRVLLGESFALVAPTGVGKTTFGIAMAHFLPGKAYIIVPTRMLVKQVADRCQKFGNKKVIAYTGRAGERKAIEAGDYDILITTSMFLATSFNLLQGRRFDFVFVDDVDALLKSGRNVDKVLKLLGFTDADIEAAWETLKGEKAVPAKAGEESESGDGRSEEAFGLIEELPEEFDASFTPRPSHQPHGILVVSSATLRPRTKRVALFRTLLGFEVAPVRAAVRNICDAVQWVRDFDDAVKQAIKWVKRFGKGGLIFVSNEYGREGVVQIVKALRRAGISAVSYDELDLDAFRQGDISVAVGIAIPTNALVRGVDLPETIRYALFLDAPKMTFPLATDQPRNFLALLMALREVSDDKARIDAYLATLRRYRFLRPDQPMPKRVQEIADYLHQQFADEQILQKLEASETVTLHRQDGQLFVTFGDAASYLQASGRTSRLFAGGVSRGISLVLAWDRKAFHSLRRRLHLFFDDVDFTPAEQVNWDEELRKVDGDRRRIRALLSVGALSTQTQLDIRTTLVIVESPNKARTIAHFFGTPQRRILNGLSVWEVTTGDRLLAITASLGHVADLVEREGIHGVLQQDGQFIPIYATIKSCPHCGEQTTENTCACGKPPERDKRTLIEALQRVAVQFDEIVIATDPDAEGEKIGYDLMAVLKPFNPRIVRAEFHEVTRRAFLQALQSPRNLERNLVKAQITRRILDRWVGFELSQRLWRVFDRHDLSAGRVQTPVLGWVIERTDLARQRKARVTVQLADPDSPDVAIPLTFEHDDLAKARQLFEQLEQAQVTVIDLGEENVNPMPPHNTGTLLAEAGSFASAAAIMDALQDLFERGLITYHRTDSVRVSDAGIKVAEELLREHYDLSLFQPRHYGTGGAHECIRPTRPLTEDDLRLWLSTGRVTLDNSRLALRLYGMIVRRFLASQMKPARVRKARIVLSLEDWRQEWEVITEVIDDGFHRVSPLRVQPVTPGMRVVGKQMRQVSKVMPFTQGSLIEEMRQRGLGRPSTYAKIVQTLLERGYIVERNGFLFATELGRRVYAWLRQHYPEFADEALTRNMEAKGDRIEAGELDYQAVLRELHNSRLFF